MKTNSVLTLTIALLLPFAHALGSENWPQWRGPNGNGVAVEGDYPGDLSDQENLVWKVELPGRGCSTPAVWEDKIFLTCGTDGHDGAVCYDFDGNQLWQQQFGLQRPGKKNIATGSNSSPVTDGRHLVVYFKSGTVACLDLTGPVKWQLNLQEKYGEDKLWWDQGTSPVLAGGNAVIAVMNAGECYVVALDLASGDVAWKQDRTFPTAIESDQGYTTPSVLERDGREVIVIAGSDHVTAHDASDGRLLWDYAGLNPNNEGMWRMIASPALARDSVVVPFGRGRFLANVRLGGSGDVTDSHEIWNKSLDGSEVPTPIVENGRIILLGDRGRVACLDVATGREIWDAQLPRTGGSRKFYASPLLAGDLLYCAREDGVVFTCKVDDGLTVVSQTDLGEETIASPVAVRDQLLIRGSEHLYLFAAAP